MNEQRSLPRIDVCTRSRHGSKWNSSSAMQLILNCVMNVCSGTSVLLATFSSRYRDVCRWFPPRQLAVGASERLRCMIPGIQLIIASNVFSFLSLFLI
jgi:hypothetical protein